MNVACTEEKFFTREETWKILRFSSSKLDAETRAGRLKVHRFGRLVRISASDLAEYLKNSKETAQ
jgi:excisionase family DNA binding protein